MKVYMRYIIVTMKFIFIFNHGDQRVSSFMWVTRGCERADKHIEVDRSKYSKPKQGRHLPNKFLIG